MLRHGNHARGCCWQWIQHADGSAVQQPSQPHMLDFSAQMVSPAAGSSSEPSGILLIRTRQMKLTPEQAKALFKDAQGLIEVFIRFMIDCKLDIDKNITCRERQQQARTQQDQSAWSSKAQQLPSEPVSSSLHPPSPVWTASPSPPTPPLLGTLSLYRSTCISKVNCILTVVVFLLPTPGPWLTSSSSNGAPQYRLLERVDVEVASHNLYVDFALLVHKIHLQKQVGIVLDAGHLPKVLALAACCASLGAPGASRDGHEALSRRASVCSTDCQALKVGERL